MEGGLASTSEVDPIIHKFKMLRIIMNLVIIFIKNRDLALRKVMVKCEEFMIINYYYYFRYILLIVSDIFY